MNTENLKIAIIGLGYVGLPLAIEFGKKYSVLGFDINNERISELNRGYDKTKESSKKEIAVAKNLTFSNNTEDLNDCNVYIVTVPTPIDKYHSPDLTILLSATEMIGKKLKQNDVVIYESTVYPGCTEEDCVPVLEKSSNLKYNKDFFCGYSPERINPGDKINTLVNIRKVTSGSNEIVASFIDNLYQSIITAGTFKASSIKVAEASKAIENSQRDLNISFVNELALIFDRLNIDTSEVLEAAGTKWNFLKFQPGLVGGHCIGVDPYYLAFKAEASGYHPQVILSGRRVNDSMGHFIANKVIKLMIKKGTGVKFGKALILGFTFKENCSDIRNTKVIDIYNELIEFGLSVDIYDPLVNFKEAHEEYKIEIIQSLGKYDCVILAVNHSIFHDLDFSSLLLNDKSVLFDVKSCIKNFNVDGKL